MQDIGMKRYKGGSMNPERKVESVTIRWTDGDSLYITQDEIEKMIKAGEALQLIKDVKDIASKLRSI